MEDEMKILGMDKSYGPRPTGMPKMPPKPAGLNKPTPKEAETGEAPFMPPHCGV